uniref:Uncharacterized protein n=1 Tax=Monopterus albus TaxID=43700 RepID=A0A3Q3KI46_MONAL
MADSKVESSGELSLTELKEKKHTEETENGEDAAANGKAVGIASFSSLSSVEHECLSVCDEEDDDVEDDLDRPMGKRAADDDDDEEVRKNYHDMCFQL